MIDTLVLILGISVLGAAVATVLVSVLLLGRMQRHGSSVMEGMAQVVFLPEKRSHYLWLMSIEGALFVLGGIAFGLSETGVVPGALGRFAFAALFLLGLVFLTVRSAVGLSPSPLTEADRATIRRSAPAVLDSLAFIPLDSSPDAEEARQRLYVLALPRGKRVSSTRRRRKGSGPHDTSSISGHDQGPDHGSG